MAGITFAILWVGVTLERCLEKEPVSPLAGSLRFLFGMLCLAAAVFSAASGGK